jgi:hypothetical protein
VAEEMVAVIQELTTMVGAVKTIIDNSEAILKDMVAWKPQVDSAMSEMSTDISVLH